MTKVTASTRSISATEIARSWHLIDAKDQVLGRLATKVATLLMGKQKTTYSAHMDSGDFVVIVNAEKIVTTGKKSLNKVFVTRNDFKRVIYALVR